MAKSLTRNGTDCARLHDKFVYAKHPDEFDRAVAAILNYAITENAPASYAGRRSIIAACRGYLDRQRNLPAANQRLIVEDRHA